MTGKIVKLDETVINRIAAGEVIQRPANALKELMENSMDAGASNISIMVASGGLKLLQVQDDGHGIRKSDLALACQRFATSKLVTFEDLKSIGTYGFRGEALASISHVARLTLVTKTSDDICAFKTEYEDGNIKDGPKSCAGKQGTTVIVEDLFFNMETRRRALKSAIEEHRKILDVVGKYSIHSPQVSFTLRKSGEALTDLRTPAKSTTIENIRILFGNAIARELLVISVDDGTISLKASGYVSNANYSCKKRSMTFILFINHRLVECAALKRAIEGVYTPLLPKGASPFVYLSIELPPAHVDVNVHPTKAEVTFLHEENVVRAVASQIEATILGSNTSRTFFVQSLLPSASSDAPPNKEENSGGSGGPSRKRRSAVSSNEEGAGTSRSSFSKNTSGVSANESIVTAPKDSVRVDHREQKLDKFMLFSSTPVNSSPYSSSAELVPFNDTVSVVNPPDTSLLPGQDSSASSQPSQLSQQSSNNPAVKKREIRLKSIKQMRSKIEEDCHNGLLTTVAGHSFVGSVDRSLALIQHDTRLFIVSTYRLSAELFYQRIVEDFGNLGKIRLDDPMLLTDLVKVALDAEKEKGKNSNLDEEIENSSESTSEEADRIHALLVSKAKMLDDYFSVELSKEGHVNALPLLLDMYYPHMECLPQYLLDLARKVNWNEERSCFETFAFQTALFYAVPPGDDKENEDLTPNGKSWKWTIEHVVFPALKKGAAAVAAIEESSQEEKTGSTFRPPAAYAEDGTVTLLTTLPDLYKVFERC